jgi:lysophospholipase L1-like esterase
MPLGDSITLGLGGGWTGYRIPLFQRTLDAGQLLEFVGSQIDGPDTHNDVPFPKEHEGHSGYVITAGGGRSGLQELIVDVLNVYQPHIVLMMIGTNDVDVHLEDLPTKLGTLMDTITDTAPNALLVAAKIVPTTDDAQNLEIEAYNAAFDDLVAMRVADGKHIIIVDMYTAFTSNENFKTEYMYDELHPQYAGYEVMTETWYAAIGSLLH